MTAEQQLPPWGSAARAGFLRVFSPGLGLASLLGLVAGEWLSARTDAIGLGLLLPLVGAVLLVGFAVSGRRGSSPSWSAATATPADPAHRTGGR